MRLDGCYSSLRVWKDWAFRRRLLAGLGLGLALCRPALPAGGAEEKISYEEHVTPILRNSCFKCHNPDKAKADLDLTTYSSVLKGGGSGKAVLSGDPAGSKLFKAITRAEEPFMPPNGSGLPEAEVELIRKWIAGGLLEKTSSQAVAVHSPKPGLLAPTAFRGRKPDGPPVLPGEWRLEPVTRTERATAATALAASPWWPLAAVGGQHQLLLYHTATLELLGVLPLPEVEPSCVQFSRDGKLLVVGAGRGAKLGFVEVYQVLGGERVLRVGNEFDTVLAADLNSDQTEIALGGPGKLVKVFSGRDGKPIRSLKRHTDWITAVQYSPDSVLLATADRNGGLVIWEADGGQELYTLTGHTAAITALSWRDDSELLLSASEDGTLRLWELKEGRQAGSWTAHKGGVLDARFAHDGRIVSCGRDRQVALWNAAGTKQRAWEAGGELPVRAAFNEDGTRVLAGTWQGRVGVWLAADGQPAGELSSNPPTLAERRQQAQQELAARAAAAQQADDLLRAAEAEARKLDGALAALDRTSPALQFLTGTRQAQAAQQQAAAGAARGLDQAKAAAAKSAGDLAAADAEAAKLRAALDQVEKYSAPYQQLAKQAEAAGQQVTAAEAKAAAADKALAAKTVANQEAATNRQARLMASLQARDQLLAAQEKLNQQAEASGRTLAQARATLDQDKSRLAQQQDALNQAVTQMTAAGNEVARLTSALANTNRDSGSGPELTRQLELAAKQLAEARALQESGQKTLTELKQAADKSAALLAAHEADAANLKTAAEAGRKSVQSAQETVAKLESEQAASVQAARQELELLTAAAAQAKARLATARTERSDVQARMEKVEKYSEAFKAGTQRLEAANQKVAALRVPADRERQEAGELEAALARLRASMTNAEAEADKVTATLAKRDPAYQRLQDLEKQRAAAEQGVVKAQAGVGEARQAVARARMAESRVELAQARMALSDAREALALRQAAHDQRLAALTAAEQEHVQAARAREKASAALAAQPARLKQLREELHGATAGMGSAWTALKKAGREAARVPASEASARVLLERQAAFRAATNRVQLSKTRLAEAEQGGRELARQHPALAEAATRAGAKLQAAKAAVAESSRELAADKARVEELNTDYAKQKASAGTGAAPPASSG